MRVKHVKIFKLILTTIYIYVLCIKLMYTYIHFKLGSEKLIKMAVRSGISGRCNLVLVLVLGLFSSELLPEIMAAPGSKVDYLPGLQHQGPLPFELQTGWALYMCTKKYMIIKYLQFYIIFSLTYILWIELLDT